MSSQATKNTEKTEAQPEKWGARAIEKARKWLAVVEAFAKEYGPRIPEGMAHLGTLGLSDDPYDRTAYDWRKIVGGVIVTIQGAESTQDPLNGSPVLPALFPVLLEDTKPQEDAQ